jgi:hypothetical protein
VACRLGWSSVANVPCWVSAERECSNAKAGLVLRETYVRSVLRVRLSTRVCHNIVLRRNFS